MTGRRETLKIGRDDDVVEDTRRIKRLKHSSNSDQLISFRKHENSMRKGHTYTKNSYVAV